MHFTLINMLITNKRFIKRYASLFALTSVILLSVGISYSAAFTYHWEIDETPEGSESVTPIAPIEVKIIDEPVEVSDSTGSYMLIRKYSVYPDVSWNREYIDKLIKTFESIPQKTNDIYEGLSSNNISIWKLTDQHLLNDIHIEYQDNIRLVTIAKEAFIYANPLLAEIEGVRGRFFSKRLHNAVVRFVTDNGADRYALERILKERYAVSINIPNYAELTKNTTSEHAGRFSEFKDEELIALISMLEEFPSGMHKISGLNYLVRRTDGTSHPIYDGAPAVAWTHAGYIEFMESAFKGQGLDYIHRLILHEKAHFLWEYLFDDQLKQDWIELGGWYENPNDADGWSTTKQVEFVSDYAHGINPNEDMAESISYYIVNPDKLRSRSPAKYEFIRNRIMHGTRYVSRIREDLTFQVYNLYPDYIYPGRIIRVDIKVEGEPEENKHITVEIEIHSESEMDTAHGTTVKLFSEKLTEFDIHLTPFDINGNRAESAHILRGYTEVSKHIANGYWYPDGITLSDVHGNQRHESAQTDFGWKLYIDNPLEDCTPPKYVPNSAKLAFGKSGNENGRPYQVIIASWDMSEDNQMSGVFAWIVDENPKTYSRQGEGAADNWGNIEFSEAKKLWKAHIRLRIPDYFPSGEYALKHIKMFDVAGNGSKIYFSSIPWGEKNIDEPPATIHIKTKNPDIEPPVLDVNRITIKAEPTVPEAPNGETNVSINFKIKDNISGYSFAFLTLRDPHGGGHGYVHHSNNAGMYFIGDPTVFKDYEKNVTLPVGSAPGTWGLIEITVFDKLQNSARVNFTEIVRFEVNDAPIYASSDINQDGTVNIQDLVLVAKAIGHPATEDGELNADINADGVVDVLDLVQVANDIGDRSAAAPAIHSPTAEQIQSWLAQVKANDDGSPDFRRATRVLENLLRTVLPETTVLLPNYPNPFNPETWIPYQLASASDVRIIIYDTKGAIVRTLDLGHQAAGYYTHRNRAAYWDGRNGLGENVASGVYFYQLQAGSVSHLRKMVILK